MEESKDTAAKTKSPVTSSKIISPRGDKTEKRGKEAEVTTDTTEEKK